MLPFERISFILMERLAATLLRLNQERLLRNIGIAHWRSECILVRWHYSSERSS